MVIIKIGRISKLAYLHKSGAKDARPSSSFNKGGNIVPSVPLIALHSSVGHASICAAPSYSMILPMS